LPTAETSVPAATRRSDPLSTMTLHGTLNLAAMIQKDMNRQRSDDPRVALLRELGDPLRLRVIDRLGHAGPASPSRLAAELEVPLPQLSNHLKRLRDARLVTVSRSGRQAIYALADPGLEALLPLLDRITGRVAEPVPDAAEIPSRTCYNHLGGRIGVDLYAALREREALRERPDGLVDLGPNARTTFKTLGVDLDAISPGRQRFAFECLDATHRAPHLAGALADALAAALIARGWVEREPGGRIIHLTAAGRRGLRRLSPA
jgi:DNA-binding transcriptional ArsR family regulator